MMTRRTIAPGVYEDSYGRTVRWRDRGRPREKRFPLDAPVEHLTAYRKEQQRQAVALAPQTGSFVRDVARFLKIRKGRPSFKSDRAHLRPWAHRFAKLSRWHVTREHVEQAMAFWRAAGYSAGELRHRLRILRQLYHALDGSSARTPADDVKMPAIPKARPVSVADEVVRDVALQLWKQEFDGVGRLRDGKTRARYLVLATTGQRPAQVKRARRGDIDLARRLWFVRPAKGDAGTVLYLNDDMRAAWQVFIDAQAWGSYDSRSFARVLRRNGWPKGVRPYNLRHSVGMGLSARQVDLGDIQAHMGHASPATTRIYVPGLAARAQAASEKLDGRIGPSFGLARGSFTIGSEEKANHREKRPHSATRPERLKTPPRAIRSKKQA